VGEALRRLVAKCLCEQSKETAWSYFWPIQVGCGSPLGAETAIHTLRQWCTRQTGTNKVLLKIDFSNAFNCVSRTAALRELHLHFPALARWAEWCYSIPTNLIFGPHTISSKAGVQQGDLLGPLLFSLAIHPLAAELASQGQNGWPGHELDLILLYLDDGVVCGSPEAVSDALATLTQRAGDLGLSVDIKKCELVTTTNTPPMASSVSFRTPFSGIWTTLHLPTANLGFSLAATSKSLAPQ
jgi:hypothetical protein